MNRFDQPRSLSSVEAIATRRAMLNLAHIVPLTDYVSKLRQSYPESEFPDFDPLDGGIHAEILFLFEKPGPMTAVSGGGSGFISRNNDDPTAEATHLFMERAKIPREITLTWNVVPGWNGTRKITSHELQSGISTLTDLISMLKKLHTVVLVGKQAQRVKSFFESSNYRVLMSAHPSPLVRASQPKTWNQISEIWSLAQG